jgi:type IV pilus assembly protein PilV
MNKSKQHGFTLIEVLVTLVIMAVGLLGLAGMQVTSLKNNESAYQRSQAAQMAYDMLDRMRVNSAGVANGDYNDIDVTAPTTYTNCLKTDTTSTCNSTGMADYDDGDWHTQLADLLPLGTGSVAGAGTGSVFTIQVFWDDDRNGNADNSFTLSSRL